MNPQTYQTLVTKCWADPDFKQRLIAEPVKTLRSEGVALPDGIKVNVVEDTTAAFTFVIPCEATELSDADLANIAGGCKGIRMVMA